MSYTTCLETPALRAPLRLRWRQKGPREIDSSSRISTRSIRKLRRRAGGESPCSNGRLRLAQEAMPRLDVRYSILTARIQFCKQNVQRRDASRRTVEILP